MAAEAGGGGGGGAPQVAAAARGRVLLQHLGAIAAANSGTIGGLALGWSSAAVAVLDGAQGIAISQDEWSWVSSLFGIGAALGSIAVGKLVSSWGRRLVILALGPLTIVAWALHLWATSVWMLYVGRLLVGMACGAACVATPIYVSEMSQPAIRGALATYFEILLCVGILLVYIFGKLLSVFWLNVACLAVSVLHVVGFASFPDTPRWYLLRGREDDARRSLRFYRGPDYDVEAELLLTKANIKSNATAASSFKALFSSASRKAVGVTIVLMILQQITGVNAITFYATQIFKEAGTFDSYSASIVVAAVEVLAAGVSMGVVDRLGRRPLLIFSGACMGLCTGLLGGYFYFKEHLEQDVSSVSWVPVILVSVFMFTFSIGWGPVIWVFVGEIFADQVKGVAVAIASAIGWFFSFVVTKYYPSLVTLVGQYPCYWGFCVLCVLACAFVGLCMPETKGKTLDEIQAEL